MNPWKLCLSILSFVVCAPWLAYADEGGFELSPTVELTGVYDHRFVPARSPDEEVDRLSNYAAGWLGVKLRTVEVGYEPTWGSFASLGVRVEPPGVGRLAFVPMIRVGHTRQFARSHGFFEEWLFGQTYGLSAGVVFSERGGVAGGRFGVNSRLGLFVFELVTELDSTRRAPRWIFSGGVGF